VHLDLRVRHLGLGTSPLITAVDGTGPAVAIAPRPEDQAAWDGTADKVPAGQRVSTTSRELEVEGAHLAGVTSAVATGTTGQGSITFEVQPGGSDTMVRLKFPVVMAVTAGGLFALALTTVEGQANAQVFFLQGEAGECSSTVTGDLTVTGAITAGSVTADSIAAGAATLSQATLGSATVVQLAVTGSYTLPPCPEGYEEDTAVFGGLYPDVHVCVHPVTGDQLVRAGDYWIDRYEASLWSTSTCSGTQYGTGTTDDYPVGFPDNGHFSTPVFSCSIAEVTPSRSMTWFQAEQACSLMGKRLCTNDEWQVAVAGTHDPGAAELANTNQCRIDPLNPGPRQTGQPQFNPAPGSTSHCISRYGAEDMIGNLWEWVADWYQAGYPWQTSEGQEPATVWGASYGDDHTWNVNGAAYHSATAYVDGIPAAGLRSGYWGSGSRAGAFAMNVGNGPSSWRWSIGARCCRGR
jgi:hypothetical protein